MAREHIGKNILVLQSHVGLGSKYIISVQQVIYAVGIQ